ncbi:MAG TPA: hypothetical protein VGZ23_11495 [bacterium]|nr:hypothetical protein [bacterium]
MGRPRHRVLVAAGILGLVLAVAGFPSPAPAGAAVVQVQLFTSAVIFFVTSGLSAQPIFLFGRPTLFPVIIQPVIVVRPAVFIAPRAVVVLSPAVPFIAPLLPSIPISAPIVDVADPPANMPPPAVESVGNVARAPELYNRRVLSVTGTISRLEEFVDERGHPYMLFQFTNDWRSISVLVGGQASKLRNGLRVQATGVFYGAGVVPDGWPSGVLQALAVTGVP